MTSTTGTIQHEDHLYIDGRWVPGGAAGRGVRTLLTPVEAR